MIKILEKVAKPSNLLLSSESPMVCVEALSPEFLDKAKQLAERLQIAQIRPAQGLQQAAQFSLQIGAQGLQLQELGTNSGPVRVDFVSGAAAHRRKFGGGQGQMIAKAIGVGAGVRPRVIDATAGLGRDAFVLAQLGCQVSLIERQALIAALLEDGLQRASQCPATQAIIARMQLLTGNAIELLQAWNNAQSSVQLSAQRSAQENPQVIYLDPMFPSRDKSALVKKEMRLFRPFAGNDDDAPQLLAAALDLATHRVVVKRPRKAPAIAGLAPSYTLEGQACRFDIYPKKSLKTKGDF